MFDLPFKTHGIELVLKDPEPCQTNWEPRTGVAAAPAFVVGLQSFLKVKSPARIQTAIRAAENIRKRLFLAHGF